MRRCRALGRPARHAAESDAPPGCLHERERLMAFTLRNRSLEKVGVIGSGQIGPDIALYFAKVLAPHGVETVVVDVSDDALASGKKKVEKKVGKGVDAGAFKPEFAQSMLDSLTFTSDYSALAGAGLVVEAATEDLGIKHKIVAQLEELCGDETILASNSSHMEPEVIFEPANVAARTVVIHYFFPAERNPMVEVVPSAQTDDEVTDWLLDFYETIGKAPIRVESRYGFAVDPIFEGLFEAAALGVEAGWGTVKEVDQMARKSLGLGIGPFTAMNLTGGNPITAHGLDEMHTKHHAWFQTPQIMKDLMATDGAWDVAGRGEKVEFCDEKFATAREAMMGAYFGLVGQVIDSGITNISDIEMAIEMALVMRPPFSWMNQIGPREALRLVEAYHADHPDFPVPACIAAQAETNEPFAIPTVLRNDIDGVAVLKIRRPKVLNALNLDVFGQLRAHCDSAAADPSIEGVVITGFGHKAFVSGADLDMLAKLETADAGEANSRQFHETLDAIEDMEKPVVCAMNGFALGGGNELAMACHARIAKKGLRMLAGQPEVNVGIIPGAGGTMRLPRLIGFEKAVEMMRSAKPISSAEGLELGLISEEVDGDLVGRAVALVKGYASGEQTLNRISSEPMTGIPDALPERELGHLSRAIDTILGRTLVEGLKLSLREGLALESRSFGACVETKDMHIGMNNFITNGPRSKAEFVHE